MPKPNRIAVGALIIIVVITMACIYTFAFQPSHKKDVVETILRPTPKPTEIPRVVPTSVYGEQTVLKYTVNGQNYWMIVPLSEQLELYYTTYPEIPACTRWNGNTLPCTRPEIEMYYKTSVDMGTGLQSVASTIQSATNNTDDQARIAISLVQHIPYDADKTNLMGYGNASRSRLPYEVIYENKGVCSEKSVLLAYLLKELGYGVALFEFKPEKHMALGIKAPTKYAYKNTGYAFVETTIPSIITDANETYNSFGTLHSTPIVYTICNGRSMTSISTEYTDGLRMQEFALMGTDLPEKEYHEWETLTKKYGLGVH